MTIDQIAATLWRRRFLFFAVLAACLGAVVVGTLSLPKTYKTSTTLFVGVNKEVNDALAFDTNIGEQLARTYTALAANPNVADLAVKELDFGISREKLLNRMSFAPVERTQLLDISAEGGSPEEAARLANTYANVFVAHVDAQFARGDTQTKIAINEPAVRPTRPSKPNPPLYIGLGALLSLLLATGAALLRDRLDNRIRVESDEDSVLDQPVVARIPDIVNKRGEASLVASDAFRLLKTNIDFADEKETQVLMVTSPGPEEGKSTVVSQLGVTAVSDGEKVVLIEADLRRPGLASTVVGQGFDHSTVGLTNYLVGVADEERIITPQPGLPGLDVIWAGPLPPNPSSLLRSQRLATLIEHLRLEYDRVIFDTAPISVGADASVMVSRMDAALFVVDARRTKRSTAQAGLNQLEKARARVLGVVLNRSSDGSGEAYGYYGQDARATGAPSSNGTARRTADL